MTKYKHLFIASGATPIGSAGRAPDRYEKLEREWQYSGIRRWAYNQAQVLGCSLGGYSHRERCSRARWNYKNIVSIFRVIQITLHILPSGGQYKSSVDSIKCAIPTAEKALDNIFSERQSREQSLNAAKLCEGKTPDPFWVAWRRLWRRFATFFRINRYEEKS